ncbi:MAG TPA: chemotaxis protein CheW, partial [Verrucomicrobiae bacterium]|nr:chemotaxis protein CheW [Verrucomicrobiae bacterium]
AAREVFDCWNKVGVSGDGSCAELDNFVHCRNCPVYSAAARQLLDRPQPPDYRREWVEHFSRLKNRAVPGKLSAVIFRLGAEWLALPTRAFQEVAEQRRIHSLPHRRQGFLLGVINIRGELLLCVSLARLLGIECAVPDDNQSNVCDRLVVTQWQGSLLTFPVNEIHGVHRYHPEELQAAPATVARSRSNFIRGILSWQNRLVGCLDEDLLLSTLNRSLA